MTVSKRTVCVDLDGVLNDYTGWKGETDLGEPRPGAREFLAALGERYQVVILTTRDSYLVTAWLEQHEMPQVWDVTNVKPPALAYVDDRAICFEGEFEGLVERIARFQPHWIALQQVAEAAG